MKNWFNNVRNAAGICNYYLFILLLITLPFPWRISHTVWLAWMFFYLLEARFLDYKRQQPLGTDNRLRPWMAFTAIAAYILLEVLSVSWCADSRSAWSLVERHLTLPMLIVVALFGVNDRYKPLTLLKTLAGASVISVFVYLFTIFCVQNYYSILFYPTDPYQPFQLPVRDGMTANIKHRLFYCTILICSLCSLPYIWKNEVTPRWQRTAAVVLAAVVLLAGIWLSFSRMSIVTLAVAAIVMVAMNVRNRRQAVVAAVALAVLAAALAVAVITNPRIDQLGNDSRVEIWTTVHKHIGEVPPYGLGAGQLHNFMTEKYAEDGLEHCEQFRFMPHNQYMSTYMELGIAGLALLLVILFGFSRCFHGEARRMALLWLLVYAVNMLTDDVLERIDPLLTLIALSVILVCMENVRTEQTY